MNKIKFIRYRGLHYKGVPPLCDVVYKSGRVVTLGADELPKTAREFTKTARARYEYDKVFGHMFLFVEQDSVGRV